MNRLPLILLLALGTLGALGTAGCEVRRQTAPVSPPATVIPRAMPTQAWRVLDPEGNTVGSVVRFEAPDASGRFLYSIRNLHGQDLGIIDALGRAYRYRPHEDAPAWLSTGPVVDGVARILDIGSAVELSQVSLDALGGPVKAPRTIEAPH